MLIAPNVAVLIKPSKEGLNSLSAKFLPELSHNPQEEVSAHQLQFCHEKDVEDLECSNDVAMYPAMLESTVSVIG